MEPQQSRHGTHTCVINWDEEATCDTPEDRMANPVDLEVELGCAAVDDLLDYQCLADLDAEVIDSDSSQHDQDTELLHTRLALQEHSPMQRSVTL